MLGGESERDLTRSEVERFSRLLDRVEFWERRSFQDSAGLDGSQAVLEGVRAGVHHVADRWSPDGTPYADLVEFLLGLCKPARSLSSFAALAERFPPPGSAPE